MDQEASKFIIDDQNELLNHIYNQDNVRIVNGMVKNKKCIIICSGNSIYFPDTYDEFRKKIICNNYYDGARMASFLIDYVELIILIRDVRKNFYVTGISAKYSSIDSVLAMLGDLTKGYEIVVAGGSAGGYMATIIGSLLKANYVISAGGQWNLYDYESVTERYCFLKQYKDNTIYNQYYDLSKRLRANNVPIFYMYGGLNNSDINQIGYAKNLENVYPIAFKSDAHAQRVSTEPYLRLLCASKEDLIALYEKNKDELIEVCRLEEQINKSIALPEGLETGSLLTAEQKRTAYTDLLYNWVKKYQGGGKERFSELHDRTVAIWGKGRFCSLLMKELQEMNVRIECIIETQPIDEVFENRPIVEIGSLPEKVDLIIVIPYYDMREIREKIYRYYPQMDVMGIDEYISKG